MSIKDQNEIRRIHEDSQVITLSLTNKYRLPVTLTFSPQACRFTITFKDGRTEFSRTHFAKHGWQFVTGPQGSKSLQPGESLSLQLNLPELFDLKESSLSAEEFKEDRGSLSIQYYFSGPIPTSGDNEGRLYWESEPVQL